jgi:hypothetical protein
MRKNKTFFTLWTLKLMFRKSWHAPSASDIPFFIPKRMRLLFTRPGGMREAIRRPDRREGTSVLDFNPKS